MDFNKKYFEYLKSRGFLGVLYRKFILYPKLTNLLESTTLDIGCGVGDFLKFRPNTVGVDINEKCIEWCKNQGLDAHLMKKDTLPFDDRSFDSAILDNVLEHIENPAALMKEINRILNHKGVLVIGVPGILGYKYDNDHKKYYSKPELISALDEFGFEKDKVFGMPLNLEFLSDKMRQYCIYGRFIKK